MQETSKENGVGRVEVFYQEKWGTVCDDGWGINDAHVVCRQLGYKRAVQALQGGDVPHGFGKIWLDSVSCTGGESSLTSCFHGGWGNHDCSHVEDAGVKCFSTGIYNKIVYHSHSSESFTGLVLQYTVFNILL